MRTILYSPAIPGAKNRIAPAIGLMLSLLLLSSCAYSGYPVTPAGMGDTFNQIQLSAPEGSYHRLWGLWNCRIPASHDTIIFAPVRAAETHVNVRRFLEDTICTDCLTLTGVDVDEINHVLTALVQIRHPFPGLTRFTGFDVRGIIISNGSLYFPSLDATLPSASMGDFTLLNPDGYTRLWNAVDFPAGSGPFPIMEYSKGKYASPGSFTGTVNPYIEYCEDTRSSFPVDAYMQREFQLTLKPGEMVFGYAIDASWAPPLVDPPVDLMTDFPDSANAPEPYITSVFQSENLSDIAGDTASFTVEMADRQFNSLPSAAFIECPSLWAGVKEPAMWGTGTPEPLWQPLSAMFTISNDFGAEEGTYPALIKITDSATDQYSGDIYHRYLPVSIKVKHMEPGELTGTIVFIAPGPPQGGFPGPNNVFVLDLETMQETQVTDFIGIGTFFDEPRINGTGTLVGFNFNPTPSSSAIEVYEIGGDNWEASPWYIYDGNMDFCPDGLHILCANGETFDTTYNLLTMTLTGEERTIIATSTVPVQNPKWSPDGKRIAFVSAEQVIAWEYSMWIYDTETEEFTKILERLSPVDHPSWSPVEIDGHYIIAYDSMENDPTGMTRDIFTINPDTLEYGMLYDGGWDESHPSYSPDGLSIVYASVKESGESDLYVFDTISSESTQLTFDEDFDDCPTWCWNW